MSQKKSVKKKPRQPVAGVPETGRAGAGRQALGRGLSAMLARRQDEHVQDRDSFRRLPVDLIRPGRYQPRTGMDETRLRELADSIRAQGVVQPIVVRAAGDQAYELIAGERRWRAAQMAGLREIPAVIRQVSDEATVAMALIENIQREDLNPLEEAAALQHLIDGFGMTHRQAGEAVGRSRAAVSNLLRLLELGPAAQRLVNERKLDMGHARALLALSGEEQARIAERIVREDLSVRATEKLVARLARADETSANRQQPRQDSDTLRLQRSLSERLGAPVSIRHSASGGGQLRIRYHSLDELEGIIARIGGGK